MNTLKTSVGKIRIAQSIIFIILLVFAAPQWLFAQNPPPGEDISAQTERFQEEAEERKKILEKKETKTPELETEEVKPTQPTEKVAFILTKVTFTGNTVFKAEDFISIYRSYIGKKVTFADLQDIMDKIKEKYKQKGYLTTVVYFPEQEIKNGKIEIKIVEGKLGETKIEGNKWFSTPLIKRYFHPKKNEILNITKIQRDILRLNQNSDMEVKTVLTRGQTPETSDITLQVKDSMPYHIGFSEDNQGTRLTGKNRTSLSFRSSSLTGLNDSLFVNTLLTRRSFGEYVSYFLPIDTYGTKAGFDFVYFWMELGKEFKSFDITGETQIWTPRLSKEIYLSEDFQCQAEIGLQIKSIKKYMADETTADDQLRLPYLDLDFTKQDSFFGGGYTSFSPEFVFGTSGFLGASKRGHSKASREDTCGFFFKYRQSLSRTQKMPLDSILYVKSQFQTANRTLPSAEQFQLGGQSSIRGYPEGDYLADIGFVLNFDWVFPLFFMPKHAKLPYFNTPLRNVVEPVFFVDVGSGKLLETMSGEEKDKFLMGTGGGFRVRLGSNIYARFEWAGRVGDKPTQGTGSSTFHFLIQSEF